MDITTPFSLDTSAFLPYEMVSSAIRFTVSDSTVQKPSDVTYTITTEVPFEYDGCYVKFIFPPELEINVDNLKSYDGTGYMVDQNGKNEILPVDSDFLGDKKWVIFKGCQFDNDSNFIQRTMQVKFE